MRPQLKSRLDSIKFAAVEQTTAGAALILGKRSDIAFPVVDVARSEPKIEIEAEFIGQSVVEEVDSFLRSARGRLPRNSLAGATVGIIGVGTVGSWVAAQLRYGGARAGREVGRVLAFDRDPVRRSMARALGLSLGKRSLQEFVRECDVIIGATGTMLKMDPDWIRDGTIVASASSWNYEFWRLMNSTVRGEAVLPISAHKSCREFQALHNIRSGEGKGGQFWLLNSGFPVNFTGVVDPIAPAQIQLTRCLMLAGAIQALEYVGSGVRYLLFQQQTDLSG